MSESALPKLKWYQGLTKYHWWVLLVAVLSWTFDCMDQRIFVLSRVPAVRELIRWEERRGPLAAELLPAIRPGAVRAACPGAWRASRRTQSRIDRYACCVVPPSSITLNPMRSPSSRIASA